MNPRHLVMALAWGLASLVCTSAEALDDRLVVFDAHAAGTMPTHFSLPSPESGRQQVSLLEKLSGTVQVDGDEATIFLAEIDGRRGTIVRLGDTLDIALEDDSPPPPVHDGRAIDREFATSGEAPRPPALGEARDASDTGEIDVWIFLHETSGEADHAKFVNWYVSWWLKDIEENVRPGVPIRMSLHARAPGLTDMDYHAGRDVDRFREVAVRGADFARSRGARITNLTKFVLFVDTPARNWGPGMLGGAVEAYGAAIASNRGHRHIFAHEIGHLLDARHEDAEWQFLCITNMKDQIVGAIPCWRYSEANDQRIRNYVRARIDR